MWRFSSHGVFFVACIINMMQSIKCLAGQSGQLQLIGIVPSRANFTIIRNVSSFQTSTGVQGTEIFRMVEIKNQADPEMIAINSQNHSNLVNASKNINYTISYNGTPVNLKSGQQRWKSSAQVKEHVINISFPTPPKQQNASNPYSDTITFTISTL